LTPSLAESLKTEEGILVRDKYLHAGLFASLVPVILCGCTSPQAGKPVSSVDVALQTPDPNAQNAGVTFIVTFDQDVKGFDNPLTSVVLQHSGTTGGQVTITEIDKKTYHVTVAGVSGEGTFTLIIPQGAAQDSLGNLSPAGSGPPVSVDTEAPVVTANALSTNDMTPALTGNVNDPTATITVSVAGKTYAATNNGNGTWALADNVISPPLANGKYEVEVSATDTVGNAGHDATQNELTVDTAAPTVAVNALKTNDSTPALTGTVDDPGATITVTVAGKTYNATSNGNGTWTLADNVITPALADGEYDVSASAKDTLGNVSGVTAGKALTIDTTAPNVGVDPLVTKDVRPVLHGTVSDPGATVQVAIGGGAAVPAANNGDGTWTLITTADIADGQYDVSATASDAVGNSAAATLAGALTVDTLNPVVTVNSLVTGDSSPALSGTVTDATATTVKVTVNGGIYDAVAAGGTWTLAGGTIAPPLAAGKYDVTAAAIDAAGNLGASTATGALTITTAPTIAGATLAADNTYMDITFSQPVYGDAAHSQPIGIASLVVVYTRSDDPVTGVTISSVQDPNGSPLVGGETQARVGLSLAGGPTEGLGYVRINTALDAIYNFAGQAALDTTGDRRLRDPANLLSGYDWSFEAFTGAAGTSYNPVNASSDSTHVHSGSRSVGFTGLTAVLPDHGITVPNDASGTESVAIGTTSGTTFKISAWVYVMPNTTGHAGDTGLRLQLEMELVGGGVVTSESDFTVPAFNTWTQITYTNVTPNGVNLTGRAWATFQTRWLNLNDSDVFVDDLRLSLP
jgi:hypothetical protein